MSEMKSYRQGGGEDEATVSFKVMTDRTVFQAKIAGEENVLMEISGYDLNIGFNMAYLKSMEDIDLALECVTDMFRRMIMERLLPGEQPENTETAIPQ